MKLEVGYPSPADEEALLRLAHSGVEPAGLAEVRPVADAAAFAALRATVDAVTVSDAVVAYVAAVVRRTRELPSVSLGASPRAGVHLLAAAKGWACLAGRALRGARPRRGPGAGGARAPPGADGRGRTGPVHHRPGAADGAGQCPRPPLSPTGPGAGRGWPAWRRPTRWPGGEAGCAPPGGPPWPWGRSPCWRWPSRSPSPSPCWRRWPWPARWPPTCGGPGAGSPLGPPRTPVRAPGASGALRSHRRGPRRAGRAHPPAGAHGPGGRALRVPRRAAGGHGGGTPPGRPPPSRPPWCGCRGRSGSGPATTGEPLPRR